MVSDNPVAVDALDLETGAGGTRPGIGCVTPGA